MDTIEILVDSDWQMNRFTSRPEKNYRNFQRLIEFNRIPTSDELTRLVTWLNRDKCPSKNGIVAVRIEETFSFLFTTTYDGRR